MKHVLLIGTLASLCAAIWYYWPAAPRPRTEADIEQLQ
jgi:hypothetical protein